MADEENPFKKLVEIIYDHHKKQPIVQDDHFNHQVMVLAITQAYRIFHKKNQTVNVLTSGLDTEAAKEANSLIEEKHIIIMGQYKYVRDAAKKLVEKIHGINKHADATYFTDTIFFPGAYRTSLDKELIFESGGTAKIDTTIIDNDEEIPLPPTIEPPQKAANPKPKEPKLKNQAPATPAKPIAPVPTITETRKKFIELASFIVGKTNDKDPKIKNWVDRVHASKDVNLDEIKGKLVDLLVAKFDAEVEKNPTLSQKLHILIDKDQDNSAKKKFANLLFRELSKEKEIHATDFRYVGMLNGGSSLSSMAELLWGIIYAIIDRGKSLGKWWTSETEIYIRNGDKFNAAIERKEDNPIEAALKRINQNERWLPA